jgi:non-heme chloroperoxidase
MSFITTEDGTRIFYKDLGDNGAPPVVLCHGWPLSSDAWDGQIVPLLDAGFRVIAHDRRGHGRSDHTSAGNAMDTYADDLAELLAELGVHNAVMVGHSTGGGEVARYIGRHRSDRVAKVVLLSAVPPIMVSSEEWPGGTDLSVFDGIRKGVLDNRSQFYLDLAIPFFGMNRPDAKLNQGWQLSFWHQGMLGSIVPRNSFRPRTSTTKGSGRGRVDDPSARQRASSPRSTSAGQRVKKGDLLFVIDPRPYQAEANRAEAAAKSARAKAELASAN